MLAFPSMLVVHAKTAGIKCPPDPDNFKKAKYPHFFVFCQVQLCRPMGSPLEASQNAEVVAKVPASKILKVTLDDLIERGLRYTFH